MPQPQIGTASSSLPTQSTIHPHVNECLENLSGDRETKHAIVSAGFDLGQQYRSETGEVQARLARLQQSEVRDDTAIEEARDSVERAKRNELTHKDRTSQNVPRSNAADRVSDNATNYVKRNPFVSPVPAPKIKVDPDVRRPEILQEIKRVKQELQPKADALAMAIARMDAEVENRDVFVNVTPNGRVEVHWPVLAVNAEPSSASGPGTVPSAINPLWWIVRNFRDQLIESMKASIDKKYGDSDGMSSAEKHRRLAELEAELLAVDRVRCQCIWDGFQAGGTLDFDPDCDPRAILGVSGPAPRKERD